MADIELVIKIPEDLYKKVTLANSSFGEDFPIYYAIKNGTVLPKGHGVLKDVTPLMRGLYEEICTREVSYNTSDVYKMIDEECSTIIEADKE